MPLGGMTSGARHRCPHPTANTYPRSERALLQAENPPANQPLPWLRRTTSTTVADPSRRSNRTRLRPERWIAAARLKAIAARPWGRANWARAARGVGAPRALGRKSNVPASICPPEQSRRETGPPPSPGEEPPQAAMARTRERPKAPAAAFISSRDIITSTSLQPILSRAASALSDSRTGHFSALRPPWSLGGIGSIKPKREPPAGTGGSRGTGRRESTGTAYR
jgi:hypothetical protein